MGRVVLDTDVLVSAMWSSDGNPARIVAAVIGALFALLRCALLAAYRSILSRPQFRLSPASIDDPLAFFRNDGLSVAVRPSDMPMIDESDRKFFDVARACQAWWVTGNGKHFPQEDWILSPAEFAGRFLP